MKVKIIRQFYTHNKQETLLLLGVITSHNVFLVHQPNKLTKKLFNKNYLQRYELPTQLPKPQSNHTILQLRNHSLFNSLSTYSI